MLDKENNNEESVPELNKKLVLEETILNSIVSSSMFENCQSKSGISKAGIVKFAKCNQNVLLHDIICNSD